LKEIASAKAGIIKPGVTAIVGPFCEPIEIFEDKAKQSNSKLIKVRMNKE